MFKIFNEKYSNQAKDVTSAIAANDETIEQLKVATPKASYQIQQIQNNKAKSAALILHDIGTKDERKDKVEDFKVGKIDFLFVYNMLLTGFDAKRLKKLYLGRLIKNHNLLQALTRVNRTYNDFRYGYVVDFADIREVFDDINKRYFEELQAETGDEMEHYSNLFKSIEEITQEIEDLKDLLFRFDTSNAEIFSQQISQIQDRSQVQALKKALANAKSLYNLIRLSDQPELLEKLDFKKLNILYRETSNHLDLLNLKQNIESNADTTNLLNVALEDVLFMFTKINEEELILADQLKNTLRQTREALASNFDQQDPKFVKLKEELERLFKQKKLNEVTQDEMNKNINSLNKIHQRVKELNRENNQLKAKYQGDGKYTRIHKRLLERGNISDQERRIHLALTEVKNQADDRVLQNTQILDNESFFERMTMPIVIKQFKGEQRINLNADASRYINNMVVQEYMNEYNNIPPGAY
ncbi:MAG: hypothetical protein QM500_15090, partial [Methylococcales bacterium]